MQVFGHRDFLLVALLGLHGVWRSSGVAGLFSVVAQHLFFVAVQLPYIYIVERRLCPFPYQSLFLQRATGCEYMLVAILKHVMSGYALPEGPAFAAVNWMRGLREFRVGLGDVESTVVGGKEAAEKNAPASDSLQQAPLLRNAQNEGFLNDVAGVESVPKEAFNEGDASIDGILAETTRDSELPQKKASVSSFPRMLWIASKSRRHVPHDVVVLYVGGGARYGGASGHIYEEYLTILAVNLLEQGFSSAACVIPEFPATPGRFPAQEALLVRCYAHIHAQLAPECHVVVAGDSTGASLVAGLLLGLCEPSSALLDALPEFSRASIRALRRPSAALLISPVVGTTGPIVNSAADYITGAVLKRWAAAHAPKEGAADENTDPLLVSHAKWARSSPECGFYVTYGALETLAPQQEAFIALLRSSGAKVRVSCRPASVHSWPILAFYTERLVDHREASLQEFSGVISRMLLWRCPSYYAGRGREPVLMVTLDEDHT